MWAKKQRKPIMQNAGDDRFKAYSNAFGADAADIYRTPDVERKQRNLYAYLTSFTIGDAS